MHYLIQKRGLIMRRLYLGIVIIVLVITLSIALFLLPEKTKELLPEEHPSGTVRACVNVAPEAQSVCFDNAYMDYAINGNHPEYCNKVISKELREECMDTILLNRGLAEDKLEICKTAFNVTVCETLFFTEKATRLQDPSICNNIIIEEHKILCIDQASVYKAIFTNKEFKCENFKDEETKLTCLTDEFLSKAIEQNNAAVCDGLKEKTYKDMCKQGYYTDKAVKNNDLSFCNNLEMPQDCRDDYYFGKAQLENNLNLCANIADNLTKNDCYGRIT